MVSIAQKSYHPGRISGKNDFMLDQFFLSTSPELNDLALLIARIFLGICFVVHGLGKLGLVGPGNMAGFTGWLKSLGVPFAEVQARMAMASEILGGTLITFGLFTRLGFALCCFVMVMAASLGHKGGGYLITNNPPGNEYALNLAVLCVVFFLLGPGAYSLDALLWQ